ncbi:Glycosyl transferase family 2 [Microlunatus soli]|uniref:Glycosyl transferase family 2 n=1 Tax=Microlunatus soli TaxID=630515 RepID=A0A1H1TAZ3_9ACTN|nr:Glycosyl transferase family 2 [Microlunatus soli]
MRLVAANRLFSIFLALGLIMRIITWLAYQPAMLYIDSFRYINNLYSLCVDGLNPVGYDLILVPLISIGRLFNSGLALTTAVQHLLGLAIAIVLYRISRGLGAPKIVSAIITLPVLLDAYQLHIEQNIMAEIWSDAILLGALWLLLAWKFRRAEGIPARHRLRPKHDRDHDHDDPDRRYGPLPWQAATAGALIAFNVPIRIIGLVVAIAFFGYLILAGARWRDRIWWKKMIKRVVAGAVAFAVLLGSYMIVFRIATGGWGLSAASSDVLYGRAATVAKCNELDLNANLTQLCPNVPLDQRDGVDAYTHSGSKVEPLPEGTTQEQLRHEFGMTVLRHQPFDLIFAVLKDFAKGFAWSRTTSHNDVPLKRWQFEHDYTRWEATDANAVTQRFDNTDPHVIGAFTTFLRAYQLHGGYTRGTFLAFAVLLGLAGAIRRRGGLRAESLVTVGFGLLLVGGAAGFEFSWRYQLPGLVFFPLAAAIGFSALTARKRPAMAAYPDATDQAALQRFSEQYGEVRFPELVVVIAAYNEEKGIGPVLDRMPKTCPTPDGRSLDVATVVVVDGASDRTAEVVAEHDAYVCVATDNRGQGGALRLGYHLAADRGARYIVTTDADGQYEIDELPELLEPILTDRADFVTGSRRLGSEEADSQIRWVGVRVFATLASILTRTKITDTSFGFRAMRAEVAQGTLLTEPQYQASELLLGVMARGARVVEVPLTMRLRNSGKSKKGGSITYGANYARVMIGTWLRDWVGNRATRRLRNAARSAHSGSTAAEEELSTPQPR